MIVYPYSLTPFTPSTCLSGSVVASYGSISGSDSVRASIALSTISLTDYSPLSVTYYCSVVVFSVCVWVAKQISKKVKIVASLFDEDNQIYFILKL